jgi:hypothetical protein
MQYLFHETIPLNIMKTPWHSACTVFTFDMKFDRGAIALALSWVDPHILMNYFFLYDEHSLWHSAFTFHMNLDRADLAFTV